MNALNIALLSTSDRCTQRGRSAMDLRAADRRLKARQNERATKQNNLSMPGYGNPCMKRKKEAGMTMTIETPFAMLQYRCVGVGWGGVGGRRCAGWGEWVGTGDAAIMCTKMNSRGNSNDPEISSILSSTDRTRYMITIREQFMRE